MAQPNRSSNNQTTNKTDFEKCNRLELAAAHVFLPSDCGYPAS